MDGGRGVVESPTQRWMTCCIRLFSSTAKASAPRAGPGRAPRCRGPCPQTADRWTASRSRPRAPLARRQSGVGTVVISRRAVPVSFSPLRVAVDPPRRLGPCRGTALPADLRIRLDISKIYWCCCVVRFATLASQHDLSSSYLPDGGRAFHCRSIASPGAGLCRTDFSSPPYCGSASWWRSDVQWRSRSFAGWRTN